MYNHIFLFKVRDISINIWILVGLVVVFAVLLIQSCVYVAVQKILLFDSESPTGNRLWFSNVQREVVVETDSVICYLLHFKSQRVQHLSTPSQILRHTASNKPEALVVTAKRTFWYWLRLITATHLCRSTGFSFVIPVFMTQKTWLYRNTHVVF